MYQNNHLIFQSKKALHLQCFFLIFCNQLQKLITLSNFFNPHSTPFQEFLHPFPAIYNFPFAHSLISHSPVVYKLFVTHAQSSHSLPFETKTPPIRRKPRTVCPLIHSVSLQPYTFTHNDHFVFLHKTLHLSLLLSWPQHLTALESTLSHGYPTRHTPTELHLYSILSTCQDTSCSFNYSITLTQNPLPVKTHFPLIIPQF